MLKKIIIGVVATAALGMGTAVLADDSNTSDAAANFAADNSGVYVLGQVGYGWDDGKSSINAGSVTSDGFSTLPTTIQSNFKKSHGVTGRVAVGYDFNRYLGVEAGFAMFQPYYRNFSGSSTIGSTNVTNAQTKSSLYAADLLGKVTLPIGRFFTFVEGGGAYVHTNWKNLNTTLTNGAVTPAFEHSVNVWNSGSKGYIRPKAGVGVGYNLTNSIAVDVSYDRIFATGKNNLNSDSYIPNINTAMVGLSYKF